MYIDKDSREKRAGIVTQARALISKPDVTREDHEQFDAMMEQADELQALAEKRERSAAIEAEMNEVVAIHADRSGRSVDEQQHADEDVKRKFTAHLKATLGAHLTQREAQLASEYRAALGVGTATAGGDLVPVTLQRKLYAALKAIGGVRQVATVITTATGAPMTFPTIDDTANVGALVGESLSHGTATDPVFGLVTLGAYKFTTGVQPVSIELLQDAAFDVEAWLNSLFTLRLARLTNGYYTNGTGSGQPSGVLTTAPVGVTTATGQATSLIADNLIDLVYSIDPAYRASPNCAFAMNDSQMKVIRKLKDANGQFMWTESFGSALVNNAPPTILGYPVVVNQNMVANLAANGKPIAFGDFSSYVIRDTLEMTWVVFREKYRDSGSLGFMMDMRSDGKLISGGAPIKALQMAAS